MRDQRGFALILTLVVTALLVALTTEFIREVFVDTSASRSFRDAQQASILADSGVNAGVKLLQTVGYRTLLQMKQQMGEKNPTGVTQKWEDERGAIEIRIEEENGKLDVTGIVGSNNVIDGAYRSRYDILVRLLKKLKQPTEAADAIADWVDPNDEPLPGGGESAYYSGLKPPYGQRNAAPRTVDELRMVRHVTPTLLPYVTVYAGGSFSQIDLNAAPKEVLMALDDDLTPELADRIIEKRPYSGQGDLQQKVPGIDQVLRKIPFTVVGYNGSVYRITATATVGETVRTAEAVIDPNRGSSFLYWREK